MAEDTKIDGSKLFGYALVTWLLIIWAGRKTGECTPGAGAVSSSLENSPSWFSVSAPYNEDPDNEG